MEKQNKYTPEDCKTILMTTIALMSNGRSKKIRVGGLLNSDEMLLLPEVADFMEKNRKKIVLIEMHSYALVGTMGERPATDKELEIIIDDDFPNSPLYPELRIISFSTHKIYEATASEWKIRRNKNGKTLC